jgi:hypothetical protein
MPREKELSEIVRTLQNHEKRIAKLEGKKIVKSGQKTWYKPGTTIEKIILLAKGRFFKDPRAISEIISELKTKDYHLKASDLTLPLRKIVRKGILNRTKKNGDGSPSKRWLYVGG